MIKKHFFLVKVDYLGRIHHIMVMSHAFSAYFLTMLLSGILYAGPVWYYPGWLRCHALESETVLSLKETFSGSEVSYRDWEGNSLVWSDAVKTADSEGQKLYEVLRKLPETERGSLVLIGHSLGGRIVVRALSKLSADGLKIRQGILLGAALPYTDADIPKAVSASELPLLNICNFRDVTLKYIYGSVGGEEAPALGANGIVQEIPNYIECVIPAGFVQGVEFESPAMDLPGMKDIASHHAKFYAKYLGQLLSGEISEKNSEIMVPQGNLNISTGTAGGLVWWKNLDAYQGWKLQKNLITGHCRILTPKDVRAAWGDEKTMRASFEKVKRQVNSHE